MFSSLFFIKCNSNPADTSKNLKHETFTGITETGPDSPAPIGHVDSTDWTIDCQWKYSSFYYQLKDSIKLTPSDNQGQISISGFKVYPAFSNPVWDSFELEFELPCYSSVFIIVIDESYNIICNYVLSTLDKGIHMLNAELLGENSTSLPDGIYRCIYRFEDIETGKFGVYEGHGDIQVKKN